MRARPVPARTPFPLSSSTAFTACTAADDCTAFAAGACKPQAGARHVQPSPFAPSSAPSYFAPSSIAPSSFAPSLAPSALHPRALGQALIGRAPSLRHPAPALSPRQAPRRWLSLSLAGSVLAWAAPQLALLPSPGLFAVADWAPLGLCLGALACLAAATQAQRSPASARQPASACVAEHSPSMNPSPPVFWR